MSAALLFSAVAGTGESDGPVGPPPHLARDAVWVEGIQVGDERSFEALFRAYVRPLLRFAESYTQDPGVAQEIIDDVFFAVWERRDVWAPKEGAAAYLFGAVRHRALNAVRNERRQQRRATAVQSQALDRSFNGFAGSIDGADTAVTAQSESEEIDRILAALPVQRRQVMVLRWRYEMTPDEIAAAMGMSRNAVYLALSRSLETLRTLFGASLR